MQQPNRMAMLFVCMHTCTYVCMYVRMYACMHVYVWVCIYVCMHVCARKDVCCCGQSSVHIFISKSMCICMYIYIPYIHTYIHIPYTCARYPQPSEVCMSQKHCHQHREWRYVYGFWQRCLHTYIHTYIYTYKHTYMHIYMHTYLEQRQYPYDLLTPQVCCYRIPRWQEEPQ